MGKTTANLTIRTIVRMIFCVPLQSLFVLSKMADNKTYFEAL